MRRTMANQNHLAGCSPVLVPRVLEGSFAMILEGDIDRAAAIYTTAWNELQRYTGLYCNGAEMSEQETAARLNRQEETIHALRLQLAAAHEHVGALIKIADAAGTLIELHDPNANELLEIELTTGSARAWLRR